MKNYFFVFWLLFFLITAQSTHAQVDTKQPYIQKKTGYSQLIVNGKPWIMLAGELHNSSSSSLEYMQPVWDKMVAMHLNTVIASVSWELLEPQEGHFDYTLVDGLVKGAREHNLKLVLIWFASWKNAESTYVPEWVKTDLNRFPRMQKKPMENTGTLSAFGENTVKADAGAFAELMKHIKDIDNKDQTVLMMQVENESGVLGTSRDKSDLAEAQFNKPVPLELLYYLKKNNATLIPEMKSILASTGRMTGTWKEVFGLAADEVFQAWFTAVYVGKVVDKGKTAYNIPMYANAWLDPNYGDSLKTNYPSGGPVSKVSDIWRAAAPPIDLLAPDIYLEDFKKVCNLYVRSGNPLFIPEAHEDARAAACAYYALGQHNAICFSPFGIDGVKDITSISEAYKSLEGFLPYFAQHRDIKTNVGFLYSGEKNEVFELGGYQIKITYYQKRDNAKNQPEAAGLILSTSNGEFYIGGFGFRADFKPLDNKGWAEYLMIEEGTFENGMWKPQRRLNGDELNVSLSSRPEFRKVKLHIM